MKKTKFHKLSIILFLIIFSNFFSQKLEIKKINEITFSGKTKTIDKRKAVKSMDMFFGKLLEEMPKEITDSINTKAEYLNIEKLSDKEIDEFYKEFEDTNIAEYYIIKPMNQNIIEYCHKSYDKVMNVWYNNCDEIDLKKNISKNLNINTTKKLEYLNPTNLKIIENTKITKKISDFDCFKVILTYEDEKNNTTKYEMWVTKQIKLLYHPIINIKQVLENYYPLELISSDTMFNGINYELKTESIV